MSSWPVSYLRKIRFSDIDSQGIVFNGNYLTYYDDAITDLFLAAGLTAAAMHNDGYDVVTAHASVDFKATASLFEEMEIGARVGKFGNTSLTFELESHVADRVTTTASIIYVTVDAETFRPIAVPQSFKDAMQAIHGDPIPGST
ncbi:MAG: acyl-CoA thioesterase [Acidimicrobiia bacterium]|nr:acyl-CoA thioesterase [Acidimicrobiia bacterium]